MPLFKVWSEDKLNTKFFLAENFAELVSTVALTCRRVGGLTLFEAPTGGAFDRLNWQHSGEFDQNFSKKSNAPGFAWGGGGAWAVLEWTGTLDSSFILNNCLLNWAIRNSAKTQ